MAHPLSPFTTRSGVCPAAPGRFCFAPSLLAGAVALVLAQAAAAQGAMPSPSEAGVSNSAALPAVTITGRSAGSVGGFGDEPALRTPQSTTLIGTLALADAGVRSLAQVTRFDAGVSDAYNAEGYWTFLSIRGFVTDNKYNFRRDGLPINAETALALDNKQRIEVLKGTSGIQAGTSAPGGLVNLVVKRPDASLRSLSVGLTQEGGTALAMDVSERFGPQDSLGLRVNAATEQIRPRAHSADGSRNLFAVAGDWRISPATLVEAEFEHSHQSQPSVPGFSLLGNAVPNARNIDPRINLNNQPWSQPVVFGADTASLRITQRLNDDWRVVAHAASQQLKTDDRIAFPFGVYQPDFSCAPCNTFASDGTFSIWDFRSDGERRRTDALDVSIKGDTQIGLQKHHIDAGVMASRLRARFGLQANNLVGVGNIDGSAIVAPDPSLFDYNTNREERSTEFYWRDKVDLAPQWQAWLGLRNSRLQREAALTDGNEAVNFTQRFTTPWLAISHEYAPQQLVYASWGEGIESRVVPNKPDKYIDAGQPLRPVKTRQFEFGLKGSATAFNWSATAFVVRNPFVSDSCDAAAPTPNCSVRIDGVQRHRGVELSAETSQGAWTTRASAMLLQARIVGNSAQAGVGPRPTNVPAQSLRLDNFYNVAAVPGLQLQATLSHEGERVVLPDNSVSIPAWNRLDLATRYSQNLSLGKVTWRAGLDNATNQRAWKESPYMFGHAYLFPLAPRTWRLSAQVDL